MTYERVCPADQIGKGSVLAREVNGTAVAIIRCDDGSLHAIADNCSHEDYPLSDGTVVGCTIECTWHGSEFDVRTGAALNLPATRPVAVYPVEVRDGDIYVSLVPLHSHGAQSSDGAQS